MTSSSVRFRVVYIVLKNNNCPELDGTTGQRPVEFWSRPLLCSVVYNPSPCTGFQVWVHFYSNFIPLWEGTWCYNASLHCTPAFWTCPFYMGAYFCKMKKKQRTLSSLHSIKCAVVSNPLAKWDKVTTLSHSIPIGLLHKRWIGQVWWRTDSECKSVLHSVIKDSTYSRLWCDPYKIKLFSFVRKTKN